MRKSTIGLCLALPVAALAFACSSSDDSSSNNGGGAGGVSSGGSAHGGAGGVSANGGTAGTSKGGTSNGGNTAAGTSSGGSAGLGVAGAADSGEAGAGEAGAGSIEVPPANVVYSLSNDATANAVFGFMRAADGALSPMAAAFPTLGAGTGVALGSEGSLAFDKVNDRVYAVNAGDNSFSVFSVNADGSLSTAIKVTTTAVSSGTLLGPKSVTFSGDTVYVLFEGSATVASKIAGWTITGSGAALNATPIAGSALTLSSATKGVDPAQIGFSPDGKWLVVTEKQSGDGGTVAGSGMIDTFSVDTTGLATNAKYNATAPLPGLATLQSEPYGFDFQGSYLVISEAAADGVGVYSYTEGVVAPVVTGPQFLVTGATPVAPCWVAVTGSLAYVANTKGPTVSGFTVGTGGLVSPILAAVACSVVASTGTATAGDGPTDESISADGKFLYVLNSGVPSLGIFAIGTDGLLTPVGAHDYAPTAAKLPVTSIGLVSR
jgi:6-phosphogluconolactonase